MHLKAFLFVFLQTIFSKYTISPRLVGSITSIQPLMSVFWSGGLIGWSECHNFLKEITLSCSNRSTCLSISLKLTQTHTKQSKHPSLISLLSSIEDHNQLSKDFETPHTRTLAIHNTFQMYYCMILHCII